MLLLLLFSLLAGIATVLSPCIIPILPAVFSGGLQKGKYRPIGIVLGLILSFSFFTLTLTSIVRATGISPDFLRYLSIGSITLFGCIMVFPSLSDAFARLTSFSASAGTALQKQASTSGNSGFLSGFILGISLGLLWTPCAGPILASITTLALTGSVTSTAVLLTLAYGVGAGIPLLLIAYGGNRALASSRFFASRSESIRKAFGVVMIATALAMLLGLDRQLQIIAIQYLPSFQPDSSATIQQALSKLDTSNSPLKGQLQGKPMDNVQITKESGSVLPDLGTAPEFAGISTWVNSNSLTLASLKGKVVLVDFWTYTCINCIRTLPYVTQWYNTYKDKGFVVIGIHTPEFEFEKSTLNVQSAVKRFSIHYPVGQDNAYATWTAYDNHYWPAHYLIDKQGHIRQVHFGEGNYTETENAIRSLLDMDPILNESTRVSQKRVTPETYLGYERATSYTESMLSVAHDAVVEYKFSPPLAANEVGLQGSWLATSQSIVSQSNESKLALQFTAGKVHLVFAGKSTTALTVLLNGKSVSKENQSTDYDANGKLFVTEDREYTLVDLHEQYGSHLLEITVPKGIEAYAFTFSE